MRETLKTTGSKFSHESCKARLLATLLLYQKYFLCILKTLRSKISFQTITKITERSHLKRSVIFIVFKLLYPFKFTNCSSFMFLKCYCSHFIRFQRLKMNYFYENSSKNVFSDRNHL